MKMHKDIALKLHNISKVYKLYNKPVDRLKEALHPLKKKYHKDFYALKNINLEIKKGEVLGIVGVNGAGKSTLLKIIAGVLTPSSGRITVNGRLNAILELGSGLKPEMTGVQNIKLNLQINGIYEDIEKLTQEIIEFADIDEHINQPVKTYSSGMVARLGFGIATSTDPDILIVDEVLAVGDVLFQRKCYSKIEKLFKDGKTVIFVSHSAQSVIEFCSNAILLYNREVILEDTPKKVTDLYQKLVFSKNKKKVINEIPEDKIITSNKIGAQKIVSNKECNINFLKELVSTPSYVNKDTMTILNIAIIDNLNKKVNILDTDEKYQLSFNIQFHKAIKSIRVGIQFKTLTGIIVSGLNSRDYKGEKIFNVKKNDEYKIVLEFNCLMLSGNYFIRLLIANDEEYSIVEDAYTFKVKTEKWVQGGLVHLKQRLNINKLEKGR